MIKVNANGKIKFWEKEELINAVNSGKVDIIQIESPWHDSCLAETVDLEAVKEAEKNRENYATVYTAIMDIKRKMTMLMTDQNRDYQFNKTVQEFHCEVEDICEDILYPNRNK